MMVTCISSRKQPLPTFVLHPFPRQNGAEYMARREKGPRDTWGSLPRCGAFCDVSYELMFMKLFSNTARDHNRVTLKLERKAVAQTPFWFSTAIRHYTPTYFQQPIMSLHSNG